MWRGEWLTATGERKGLSFHSDAPSPGPLASRCLLLPTKEKRWQLLAEPLRASASPQRGACPFPACDHLSLNGLIFWLIQLEISLVPWNKNKGTVLKILKKRQNRNHRLKKKKTKQENPLNGIEASGNAHAVLPVFYEPQGQWPLGDWLWAVPANTGSWGACKRMQGEVPWSDLSAGLGGTHTLSSSYRAAGPGVSWKEHLCLRAFSEPSLRGHHGQQPGSYCWSSIDLFFF